MALPTNGKTGCEVATVVVPPRPTYCPDIAITGGGFGFTQFAPPDPLATVLIEPCTGDTGFEPFYIYPAGGTGHSTRIEDCAGLTLGFAVNVSPCAIAEPVDTNSAAHPINIVNNIDLLNTNNISNSVASFGTDANGDYILTLTDGTIFKAVPLTC